MKKIYLLFLLGMVNFLGAQEPNINFPTTPEFKKFAKNIDYPIDLNTGGISYSVPLFSVPLKNLDINFNLNYSSYGVKVGDLSNEFGHDWSLNIPKISREVRGIPDEFAFGYINPQTGYSTANMADKASKYNPYEPINQDPNGDIHNQKDLYIRAYNGEYDLQADKFYFNINGKSGYFMFKDESRKIITYPFQDLKIYPDLPNSIKIVDTDGTEYHFGNTTESREINNNNFTTGWYISKIINNNNIVTFDYDNIRTVYQSFSDEYKTIGLKTTGAGNFPNNPIPSNKIYSTNIIFKPIIKKIHYKNLAVNFSYLDNNNFPGIKTIDKIAILKNSKEAYSYLFNMSKYTSYDQTNNTTIRTFLDNILLKDDKKTENYYSFNYINPSNLPGRLSFKLDLWGFYNSNTYSTIIPSYSLLGKIYNNSDRRVNSDLLKSGILSSITLPTKGSIQIETEPNEVKRELLEYLKIGDSNIGSIHLYNEDEDDYIYKSLARIITEPVLGPEIGDNTSFPSSYNENFILNEKSLVQIRVLKQFIEDGACISSNTNCPNVYLTGTGFYKKLYEADDNSLITLEAGNYSLVVENLSSTQFQRKNVVVRIDNKVKNEVKKNKFANGLRVKSITHYDNNGKLALKKSYNYNKENGSSSGELINLGFFTSYHFPNLDESYYIRLNSYFRGINNYNGIHYNYVTEIVEDVKNHITNKSIYNYYSPLELSFVDKLETYTQYVYNIYSLPINVTVYPKILNWRLNLLKSKSDFKDSDLVKKITNEYIFTINEKEGKYDYNFNIDQSMGSHIPIISQSPSEQSYLSKTTTTEYFDNSEPITTEINYNYDSENHLQLTKQTTKNSKGEVLTTEYQYPSDLTSDYPESTKMTRLVNENRIAEPVIIKQQVGSVYVSEIHNQYKEFNGILQKSAVFQKKGENIDLNKTIDRKIVYNSYDAKGNITQYTPENGPSVAIIWGYNSQYPVAKLEGIIYDDAKNKLGTYLSKLENGLLTNDEQKALRLLIPEAMVTTYVYKPLVGVTTITGPNGMSEFYKYDEAGRLQEIRNDKQEVLKTFQYNYKN